MRTITCPCGTHVEIVSASETVGQTAKKSGYFPVFIADGGLEFVCPACTKKMREASVILRTVFGKRLRYVHMLSVSSLTEMPDE